MADVKTSGTTFSVPSMEREIIRRWEEGNTFAESLRRTQDKPIYTFYDGPPFATGLPHHGHLLQSTIKDIIPRFWTMKGRYVSRRFGWDCHGLPIEHEIDKQLGLTAQEAVEKLGIAGYCAECRRIVDRYVVQWREVISRLGRWADFDNDYKTMDAWYMESVWAAVKQLWDRDLIYQDFKVMPVSTALGTPVSNFEAASNHLSVQDPSVTVLFKLTHEDAYVAAWTTTPWTLPSNLALCVGAEIDYVLALDRETEKRIYIAKERFWSYAERFGLDQLHVCKGSSLVGKPYEPLFPYYKEKRQQGAFVIVADDYVKVDEGTGIVHQAPAFGEDDYRIAKDHKIDAFVCPVEMNGYFNDEVVDFAGQYVKDADKAIIAWLKDRDRLWEQSTIQHNYPYCYRSDTPLIYRAVPSWFVRVTRIRDTLLATNNEVNWVPEHIKTGRFGNWLENAIDWAISRNRVWGTPLPIWINDRSGKSLCIGSIDELKGYSGITVDDLHREHVDPITFTVPGEEGEYQRIPEILDCWFESGSMPYAQLHYPFENNQRFEQGFPADFISEGVDQTRGWFYTLMVLAAAIHQKPAFKNVIASGMILAKDGRKMSKRLQNYTEPMDLFDTYGSDAVRLYLINSTLVRAEEQRFDDAGVEAMVRRFILPLHSVLSFMQLYGGVDEWTTNRLDLSSENILDRWLLSKLQTIKQEINRELEHYRLNTLVQKLIDFISDLNNWYVRLNRSRFWSEGINDDKNWAYSALYTTLAEFARVIAPLTPFIAEHLHVSLDAFDREPNREESVHFCSYPTLDEALVDSDLETQVSWMQQVVLLGRRKREEEKINLRVPLHRVTVIHQDQDLLHRLNNLASYIQAELNVKSVDFDSDEEAYIRQEAKPNFPLLGQRFKEKMRRVQARIASMTRGELSLLRENGSVVLDDDEFTTDEIEIQRHVREGSNAITDRMISIDLDCSLTDELELEGLAREAVHRVQTARKSKAFEITDRISLTYGGSDRVVSAISRFKDYVAGEILATSMEVGDPNEFVEQLEDETFLYSITRQTT